MFRRLFSCRVGAFCRSFSCRAWTIRRSFSYRVGAFGAFFLSRLGVWRFFSCRAWMIRRLFLVASGRFEILRRGATLRDAKPNSLGANGAANVRRAGARAARGNVKRREEENKKEKTSAGVKTTGGRSSFRRVNPLYRRRNLVGRRRLRRVER